MIDNTSQSTDGQGQSVAHLEELTLQQKRTITDLRGDVCNLKRKLLQQRKTINERSFTEYLYDLTGNAVMVLFIVCFTLTVMS